MAEAGTMNGLTLESEGTTFLEPQSRGKRIAKKLGWAGVFLFFLALFTVLKLPEEKVRGFIQGQIRQQLEPMGIGFSAEKSSLSVLFGFKYSMEKVTLTLAPPASPILLDRLTVSPSLFSLLRRRLGGTAELQSGSGSAWVNYSMRTDSADPDLKFSYELKTFDLSKLAALGLAFSGSSMNLTIAGTVNGSGGLNGNLGNPGSLTGDIQLEFAKIALEPLTVSGFVLPKLAISTGTVDIGIAKSVATVKAFKIGKPGLEADDLHATVTGDVTLARSWDASILKLKTNFSLSAGVMKALILVDALLAPFKQPDGTYAYPLEGTLSTVLAGGGGHM